MVEGGEKGVGRVAQSALQHAACLYAAEALPFEAADDVECLLHIAYDRANIDLRRLARQPYAAFIAADRLKIPFAAERLDDLHHMPAGDVETRDDLADRRQRLALTAGEHQHAHRVIGMQGQTHWDPHRDRDRIAASRLPQTYRSLISKAPRCYRRW